MLLALSYFILSTYATGAEVESFAFSINDESNRMYIGHPITPGMALGMTHIITKLW